MIIQVISYLLLIVSALYFTSQISEKRLSHCLYVLHLFIF